MDFIKPEVFTAKLEVINQLTEDVFEYRFSFDAGAFTYKSGHFAMMMFDCEGKEEQRAYSISSAANEQYFELCVKLLPDGKGSNYLRNLKEGDEVKFKGPFGMFILKEGIEADLLLIGTGTGIAPIKGIIAELLTKGDQRQIHLVFGVRYAADIFYNDYFTDLAAKHSNFHYTLTCSRPKEGEWNGECGRVTDHLSKYNFADPNLHMFVCGNGNMVKDVRNHAIENGMDKKSIHVENFG